MSPLNESEKISLGARFRVKIKRFPSGHVNISIEDAVETEKKGEPSGNFVMFNPNNPTQTAVSARNLSDSLVRRMEGYNPDELIPFFMGMIMQALQNEVLD